MVFQAPWNGRPDMPKHSGLCRISESIHVIQHRSFFLSSRRRPQEIGELESGMFVGIGNDNPRISRQEIFNDTSADVLGAAGNQKDVSPEITHGFLLVVNIATADDNRTTNIIVA